MSRIESAHGQKFTREQIEIALCYLRDKHPSDFVKVVEISYSESVSEALRGLNSITSAKERLNDPPSIAR